MIFHFEGDTVFNGVLQSKSRCKWIFVWCNEWRTDPGTYKREWCQYANLERQQDTGVPHR